VSAFKLIGLMRDYVLILDEVAHVAAIVARAEDVKQRVVQEGNPVLTAEGTVFSPLCDQFDAEGPLDTYDTRQYPDIRYCMMAGEGVVNCLACLSIHLDEWFPPENEFQLGGAA
jgi:hypothetical protein